MSYDLAVFDPREDLRDRQAFEAWYDEITEWEQELDFNDPTNVSSALQSWFHEIRQAFVPLNGPFAARNTGKSEEGPAADYTLAPGLIYVGFSWSNAEQAYLKAKQLAQKYKLGFLDASGDEGAAWFPAPGGSYQVVHVASGEDE